MWKWCRALVTGVSSENCLVKTIEGNEQNGVYHSAGRFYKTIPLGTGTLIIYTQETWTCIGNIYLDVFNSADRISSSLGTGAINILLAWWYMYNRY